MAALQERPWRMRCIAVHAAVHADVVVGVGVDFRGLYICSPWAACIATYRFACEARPRPLW